MRPYTPVALQLSVADQVAALRARIVATDPLRGVRRAELRTRGPRVTLDLQPVPCATCGITFGVPREYFDARVADGRAMTCPNACAVRLGLESSGDRMVRALGTAVDELTAALGEARQLVSEQHGEIAQLRQAVVDQVVGAVTAPEDQ